MPYVDKSYYDDVYMGAEVAESEFSRLAKRAREVIDQLTRYRIGNFDDMPEQIRERIKQAVCAQIEFYALSGGYDSVVQQSGLQNVSIGSFNYSIGGSSSDSAMLVGNNVIGYLKQTGSLYSGVGVRHDY